MVKGDVFSNLKLQKQTNKQTNKNTEAKTSKQNDSDLLCIDWQNEGHVGPVSFNFLEGHRTYFRQVSGDRPVVDHDYRFDNIHLPSVFSVAVGIDSGKCPITQEVELLSLTGFRMVWKNNQKGSAFFRLRTRKRRRLDDNSFRCVVIGPLRMRPGLT